MSRQKPTTPAVQIPNLAPYFAANGPLGQVIPGYQDRPGQRQLAQLMAEGIATKQHVIAEASTGIGKSMAYLIAVAASGQKAIVSTHTKALQQQLAEHDIPRLQVLFPQLTTAVLKGRSNYACLLEMSRLDSGERQTDLFDITDASGEYQQLSEWLRTKGTHGDLDQAPFPISDGLRLQVTVDGYGCLGRKCPFVGECYSEQAKARAQAADIVIVNHAILLLDVLLGKSVGLLPPHPVVIIDEAHSLEGVATDTFGVELTSGRWRVIERKLDRLADELQNRLVGTQQGELLLDYVTAATGHVQRLTAQAEGWFERVLAEMGTTKTRGVEGLLHEALKTSGVALVEETQAAQRQVRLIAERLKSSTDEADLLDAERWLKLEDLMERTQSWLDVGLSTRDPEDEPVVRYVERLEGRASRAALKVKPIRVARYLAEYLWSQRLVVATSATLATGHIGVVHDDPFAYWRDRVGAGAALELVIPSPFPYATATRLYIPTDASAFDPTQHRDPSAQARYREHVLAGMLELLQVRRGGAFVLCTSVAMMRAAAAHLTNRSLGTVYVQGDLPPARLIERFKADGAGVLIGTRTFWEGVDVVGSALSLVIIDKLPFGVPDDPLWEARCRDLGDDWFRELALPTTLMALKQGVGRLMRSVDDRGVIAILDGRLRLKNYGGWIIQGLPPAPLVGEVKDVERFFATRSCKTRGRSGG